MTESTVVFRPSPEGVEDPLTEVLRAGARTLVRHAVEAELAALLTAYEDERTETVRRRLVRHGHGPARTILTGIGAVTVRRPKVRDRVGTGEDLRSLRPVHGAERLDGVPLRHREWRDGGAALPRPNDHHAPGRACLSFPLGELAGAGRVACRDSAARPDGNGSGPFLSLVRLVGGGRRGCVRPVGT